MTDQPKETGHYDMRCIPICVGDLVRVKHFRHYRRREQMWLYFRVDELNGCFVVYGWNRLNEPQCLLKHLIDSSEVLAGVGEVLFNERKRRRV